MNTYISTHDATKVKLHRHAQGKENTHVLRISVFDDTGQMTVHTLFSDKQLELEQ